MDQLLREFLGEAEELIEALVGDMQVLRERHTEGRARRELIGRIFRHVHTLKGSAAAVELDSLTAVAHEFETLLDGVRLGRVTVDADVLDAFEDTVSALSQMLRSVSVEESPIIPQTLLETLRRLADKGAVTDALTSAPARLIDALPEDISRSLSEYEQHRLHEALGEGARLFIVDVNFDLATFDDQFRGLSDALSEGGEIVSTLPGMGEGAPDQINFRIVYASDSLADELRERLTPFGPLTLIEISEEKAAEANDEEAAVSSMGVEGSVENAAPTTIAPLTSLVRVELGELDEMITATHELFTDTMSVFDLALSSDIPSRGAKTELEMRAARIRRRFVELEESLIRTRMIPVAQTLTRAVRAGKMAARTIGKEIDFEIEGGEVQLDKSLADTIADPLLHLLRNAVDHGIETNEEREASGKSERGQIKIEALAEGSRVRLRIKDDGRGIDPERVAQAAIERGLIERSAEVSGPQALRLIFAPGFSTAGTVSNVSGRGVGLDVVESAVEQVGGEIRVFSEIGAGTTFELSLPTTLALVSALIIHSAGHRYCIDSSHIAEAGFVNAQEVEQHGDAQVIHWRGAVVPLVRMRELLSQPPLPKQNGNRLHVILTRGAEKEDIETPVADDSKRTAVVVDGWDGHHEVLVRGLGRHGARWRGIGGATELGNGTVALILDLPRLLEMI